VLRLSRHIKAYIEAELRDYHQTKHELEELKSDLINMSPNPPDGMPRGGTTGNPTEGKCIRLITNKRIRHMEKVIDCIKIITDELPPEKYELVRLKYWTRPQTLTDAGIAQQIGCDRSTLWRWNSDIITAIGIELGLVDGLKETCNKLATFE
jgi:RinA family phage transcriptional activator